MPGVFVEGVEYFLNPLVTLQFARSVQVAALGRFGAPFANHFERGVVVHSLAVLSIGASGLAHSVWVDRNASLGYN